ncbi:phosphatidylinositol-specific phospholipase C domain-containing protein [Kitasatospora sp. NPDC002227]|uniref:phosphatidylinositol-specific phospholipase C domain-containing protein n=1 Tax=Kitasatospora sp. NPDC002227 TaxID=3154773 RepID=UPI00331A972D
MPGPDVFRTENRLPDPDRPRRRTWRRAVAHGLALSLAVGAALLLPGQAVAAGSVYPDAVELGSTTNPDWMKNISGRTPLSAMSIPGTHETLAIHGIELSKAQQDFGDSAATLATQLEHGIRAIDIRVRVTEGKYFVVHHGAQYQYANFTDVLSKTQGFLRQHPGETVLMRLRAECPRPNNSVKDCTNDPSTVNDTDIKNIFDRYANTDFPGLFYGPSVNSAAKTDMPVLGDARGKIVLTTFDNLSAQYGVKSFGDHTEDDYDDPGINKKYDEVRANLEQAVAAPADQTWVTYTSASGIGASPMTYAGGSGWDTTHQRPAVVGVNLRLMWYLNGGGGNGRLGIVMMDYPGWALIEDIVARNSGSVVKGGHQAIWQVNADKTYVDSRFGKCMVRGPEFDSSKTGGLVTQRTCQSSPPSSHQWSAVKPSAYDGKGYFWIKAANGSCLTAPYNNGTPPPAGTQLFWWGCETRWFSGNQLWNVIPTPLRVGNKDTMAYKFINQWTGLCLSVDPATAATSGGKVTLDSCPG